MEKVIAMYDIREIQKYIYRTQKVKDAMGASALVENMIERALEEASREYAVELKWHEDGGALSFEEKDIAVQVLFIGGGNAYVLFESEDVCQRINKKMAKYVLEQTYSLQLAAAYVHKTDNYSEDYKKLHEKMNLVKANIKSAKPIGALPIMQIELKTGYPLSRTEIFRDGNENIAKIDVSTETYKKDQYKRKVMPEQEEKIFDNLIYKKGIDSNLAVIHIDGNNMGSRIQDLIQYKTNYEDAVNEMRKISYNIKFSYLNTFEEMRKQFEPDQDTAEPSESQQEVKKMVRKIIVAGDDITYVCNARIAFDTVEYFARKIARRTMNGELTDEAHLQYGFSICAGIAFMKSHFPFSVAYDVAEACCDQAKDRAKKAENRDDKRIGNYVDFQICNSVQCRNLDEMRRRDYVTPIGEALLIRPYYIPTEYDGKLAKSEDVGYHYNNFKKNVQYFLGENIPRSYAKQIRNTYPLGSHEMSVLAGFLKSRGWEMPDGTMNMFGEDNIALWYDALEMMDYCIEWKEAGDKKEEDLDVQKPVEDRIAK